MPERGLPGRRVVKAIEIDCLKLGFTVILARIVAEIGPRFRMAVGMPSLRRMLRWSWG